MYELAGKSTAWEHYFNHLSPTFPPTAGQIPLEAGRTTRIGPPYRRMKRAGISSKTAEQACFWTVTILDDPKYKNLNFILP